MGMKEKLASVNERREQIEHELAELRQTRQGSSNSALADLEKALTTELAGVQEQIDQINGYLQSCSIANGAECS